MQGTRCVPCRLPLCAFIAVTMAVSPVIRISFLQVGLKGANRVRTKFWAGAVLTLCLSLITTVAIADEPPAAGYVPAKLLERDRITYPREAQLRGREGLIYYSFAIGPDGSTSDISFPYLTGSSDMHKAVKKWISRAKYQAATLDGSPITTRSFGSVSFVLNGKTRGASRRFVSSWRKFTDAMRNRDLAEAREQLDELATNRDSSLYEELYLHQGWVTFLTAQQDYDAAYPHLKVIERFYDSDGTAQDEVVPIAFFYGPFLEKYQYEAQKLMLGDARQSLQVLQELGPEEPNTTIVREHFNALVERASGRPTRIDMTLDANFHSGDSVSWNTWLLAQSFAVQNVEGAIDVVVADCDGGQLSADVRNLQSEIHLPQAWSDCRLHVRGATGTSFSLWQAPTKITAVGSDTAVAASSGE
uniref:Ferric siderophore transport system, periplasmic binding protein TonB n=1 Tax=Haliea sp. ETY-M TaxID=1055105 RepID=A0A455R3N5_9GAMM|nr:ferric siderophore transport system, periplasmic binding protein TonB [Haliea sp. ETY-M]